MDNNRTELGERRSHRNGFKDKLRGLINIIVAFLLSLFFVLLTSLLVIQWSGFSRSIFYKNMAANQYYDHVLRDFREEADAITLPIGLPIQVLDNIVSSYKVSQDVNGYINSAFNNETYTPDTMEITNKLNVNVHAYLENEGIELSDEQENNLSTYITTVEEIYLDTVKVPLITYYMKAKNMYSKVFSPALLITIAFILICICFIIKMNRWLHRGLRYISYSTVASGLMVCILPLYILKSGFYKKIHLSPEYFYNFFTDYITNFLNSFLYLSLLWGVISISLFIAINVLKGNDSYWKRK